MHRERIRGQGLSVWKGSGCTGVLRGRFLSRPPPTPPPRQHFCCRWHLSLPSAGAILGCRTYQLSRPGLRAPPPAGKPGSGKQEQGLGKQVIRAAWQFPPALERRGLQSHSRWLNIGTLRGGSGSCWPQGAIQFLLLGAAMRLWEQCW